MTLNQPFAAFPGTYIYHDESEEKVPVIAWAYDEDSTRLVPVTFDGIFRMISGCSLILPDGFVEDAPLSAPSPAREAATVEPGAPQKPPAEPTGTVAVPMTNKSFKTNSWWRYTDEFVDFIFEVPGEQPVPKATDECQKIKRTEFTDAKKEGVPVETYLDVKNGLACADTEIDEGDESPVGEDEEDLI